MRKLHRNQTQLAWYDTVSVSEKFLNLNLSKYENQILMFSFKVLLGTELNDNYQMTKRDFLQ